MAAIGDLVANLSLNNAPFRKSAQQSQGILSQLGGAVTGTVARIGALVGGISIAGAIGWGGKLAMDAEQAQIAFEVMLGSADKARQILADLQAYSDRSPFSTKGVRDSAQQLLNYGIVADDLLPTIKMLGDVAAGDEDKMQRLGTAFGQMSSTGRLMGQDLLQFINAGFNPLQEISKKTGESMAVLKKRMEAGGISTKEVVNAFRMATSEGGRFFGMTDRQSQTIAGKFSTLKDNIANSLKLVAASIMTSLDLSGVLDRLNATTAQIPFYFNNAGKLIEIEIIGWQLYLDKLLPGTAQIMQDIGIVIQATWAAATTFFTSFIDTMKAGFQEALNLSQALQSAWDAAQGSGRSWWGWMKEGATNTMHATLELSDVVNEDFLGGGANFAQNLFGFKGPVQQTNKTALGAFDTKLASQKDALPPGQDALTLSLNAFKTKIDTLVGNGGSAGGLVAELEAKRADMLWQLAESGDTSGYGGASRVGIGSQDGSGNQEFGKINKADKADSKAANRGSSDAASIMTRGLANGPAKQQVELTKIQNNILTKILKGQEANLQNSQSAVWNIASL